MKGYTDLSQSKKLAEFLPLKSADMFYNPRPSNEIPYVGNANTALLQVPCWSLSALLELMPKIIFVNGRTCRLIFEVSPHTTKDKLSTKVTYLCLRTGTDYGHIINNNSCLDAVFQMICWLKENDKI